MTRNENNPVVNPAGGEEQLPERFHVVYGVGLPQACSGDTNSQEKGHFPAGERTSVPYL